MRIDVRSRMLLMLALSAAMGACTPQPQSSKERKLDAVAQSSPQLEPLPPTPPSKTPRARVASEGDCAPRYPNGARGTCINNQPCRGYGVRNPDGKAVCTCYGRDGGCAEGQRCDGMRLTCVPQKEPLLGRGNAE